MNTDNKLGNSGIGSYDHAELVGSEQPSFSNIHVDDSMSSLLQYVAKDRFKPIEISVPGGENCVLLSRLGAPCTMPSRIGGVPIQIAVLPKLNVFIPSGESSWWGCDADAVNGWFHLHFSPETILSASEEHGVTYSRSFIQVDDGLSALIGYARALTQAGETPTKLVWDSLATLILHRIAGIIRMPQSRSDSGERLSAWQARRSVDYLHAHLSESIRLADVAAVIGLSTFHFARAFKNTIGVPPHRYQFLLRIEKAKELLASGEVAILDVAMLVGYESQSSFARSFKAEVGMSPIRYRKLVGP